MPPRCARVATVASLLLAAPAAQAAPPLVQFPTDDSLESSAGGASFVDNLARTQFLLGDLFGLRSLLGRAGISLAIQETSEVLGNATGGARTGLAYDGLTQVALQLDTMRAFGWYGGTFNVSGLQLHGQNLSATNLLTLQTSSGIEGDRATRLWELWYQQKFLEEDRLDIRVGQQSLDQEFMVSQNANYFMNTMFGWPMLPSANLPGGGPAYPLSALGVRLRARPTDSITLLAGVFNGAPDLDPMAANSQQNNPHGTSFPLNGGALVIGELQYAYPALGAMIYPGEAEPLSRLYKLGFWWNSESFADQQFDNQGLSLASPASNGNPLLHHGNYGIYAVADQMVWVDPREPDRTVSVFFRPMGSPQGNRNLISVSLNAGVVMHEPFRGRDDDTVGIGMGYTHVTSAAAAFDQASAFYSGAYVPVRGGETYVELTYQYQVAPWMQLQPDFQYVFNPGAGIANPNQPAQRVKNEAVFGLRTNVTF